MIYLHETHDVIGGKMDDFSESMRTRWRPLVERDGLARVLWFFKLATGTNVSYQAISITAVKDWQSWGTIVNRMVTDPEWKAWDHEVAGFRRDVESRILLTNPKSPLQEVDFASVEAPAADSGLPSVYLHDTGWPYPGLMDEYVDALHSILEPQMEAVKPYVITVAAGWRTSPGALRAVLLHHHRRRAGAAARRVDGRGAQVPRQVGEQDPPHRRLVPHEVGRGNRPRYGHEIAYDPLCRRACGQGLDKVLYSEQGGGREGALSAMVY